MSENIDRELRSWKSDFYRLKRNLRFSAKRLEDGLGTGNQFEAERWRGVSNAHASKFAHSLCRYDERHILRGYNSRTGPIDRLQRECNGYVRRIHYLNKSQGAE